MICRIAATAELDERPDAADATRARAHGGDAESAWLLEQWQADRLLLARITVTASARDDRGQALEVRRVIDGVWLERDSLPTVEGQVADVAPKELPALAAELRDGGVTVDDELENAFLHVELGERLVAALAER